MRSEHQMIAENGQKFEITVVIEAAKTKHKKSRPLDSGMKCFFCGQESAKGLTFCPRCGAEWTGGFGGTGDTDGWRARTCESA